MRQTSRTICIEPLAGALWGRLELSNLFNFAYKLSVFNTEDTEDCYNLVIDLVVQIFTNFNKFFCTFSVDEHTVKYILVYIRLRHQDSHISIYSTADSNCEIQRLDSSLTNLLKSFVFLPNFQLFDTVNSLATNHSSHKHFSGENFSLKTSNLDLKFQIKINNCKLICITINFGWERLMNIRKSTKFYWTKLFN